MKNLTHIFSILYFCTVAAFFAGVLVSCNGANGGSGSLTVTSSQNSLTLINASTTSCQAVAQANGSTTPPSPDVTQIYFAIPSLKVSWKQTQSLTVQWVNVTITSNSISGGSFTCTIAGQALLYDWFGNAYCPTGGTTCVTLNPPSVLTLTASAVPNPGVANPTIVYSSNACPLTCGGINMIDPKKSAYGTGTIKVFGTYDAGGGNTVPVLSEAVVSFSYQGTGN